MLSKYSIKDLERLSGIKAHTLRIWELRYNILKPERTSTNIRYYNSADLRRILNISILNRNGHKISSIAGLDDKSLAEQVEVYLDDHLKESNKIESLYLALLNMDENRFEHIISGSVQSLGFENTVEKILFPFLRHLGNMWQVGAITPAQEHYISNLVRQKLLSAIDGMVQEDNPAPKNFLFFLADNEWHELALIYTCYLAKLKGHNCIYLGQSVPLEDLVQMARVSKPDYLVTIFTTKLGNQVPADFLKACVKDIPGPDLLLSGRLFFDEQDRIALPSSRCYVFEDFAGFRKWL